MTGTYPALGPCMAAGCDDPANVHVGSTTVDGAPRLRISGGPEASAAAAEQGPFDLRCAFCGSLEAERVDLGHRPGFASAIVRMVAAGRGCVTMTGLKAATP